ncbi:bifunctional DNA primase/polymerase [Catellatospora sp. NPDC049609]|uniref:bifunctional DNA primase/polymerase n=1 Tax=Catellatospora sp. NPDC049609 TaxID=3155505 RepID=UPI00341A8D96
MNDHVKAALSCAMRGWRVFPLVPNAKEPAVRGWETRATTDPDRIRRCWSSGPYNIGIATGPSELVVVDLDRLKGDDPLPAPWAFYQHGSDVLAELRRRAHAEQVPTHTVATGSGGTHLYYRHPAGPELRNTQGRLGPLIDTRAHGGYVVGPGSVVAGRTYPVAADLPVAGLPAWLAIALAPAPLPEQAPVVVELGADRAGRYVAAAIDAQVRHLEQAAKGTRNHALYTSAVALGQLVAGGAIRADQVEGLLTQAAHRIGLRPMETARTIASGLRAGAVRPRTVAA